MREIKIRVWDNECIEWLYGEPVYGLFPSIHGSSVEKDHYGDIHEYTGLKDKNGKEIYEGDVVKHRKLDKAADSIRYGLGMCLENEPQIVEYTHCGFHPFAGWIDEANKDLEWEVIGNIYENPELLRK